MLQDSNFLIQIDCVMKIIKNVIFFTIWIYYIKKIIETKGYLTNKYEYGGMKKMELKIWNLD